MRRICFSKPLLGKTFPVPLIILAAFVISVIGCGKKDNSPKAGFTSNRRLLRMQTLGQQVYAQYCIHCHGSEGHGDGLNAYNLKVKPPDFSSSDFQNSKKDLDIEKFVELGGRKSGKSALCPEWGKTLSTREVTYVRHFIRALGIHGKK